MTHPRAVNATADGTVLFAGEVQGRRVPPVISRMAEWENTGPQTRGTGAVDRLGVDVAKDRLAFDVLGDGDVPLGRSFCVRLARCGIR